MDDCIQVAVRIRPLSDSEKAKGSQPCIEKVLNEPQVIVRNADRSFTFNSVFGPDSSQTFLYETAVSRLVNQLFKGFNVTILAYGQTGSGKTYSMGTCYDGIGEMGIIPRAIGDIFSSLSNCADDFKVKASFIELYNENLYDLLSSAKSRNQCIIDIREDSKGICIPGLSEIEVFNYEDTIKVLMMGSSGRSTGATNMNSQSSRSHAIFTLTIHMSNKNNIGGDTVSKFHLVDLAGSERQKKTGATGERLKEGININRGLLALGNVIEALGSGSQQRSHVPYRDSKLTRLLQDSLGGNSMTLMIACVSPADYNYEETISTLRYADRARRIKNKPIINQDPRAAEILRLQKENTELRLQLITAGDGAPMLCPKEHSGLEEEISILKLKLRKLTDTLNNSLSEYTNLMERALLAEAARDRLSLKLAELNAQCNDTLVKFDQSTEKSPSSVKNHITVLKDLQAKIVEVQAEQRRGEEEIKKHELLAVSKCTSQPSETSSGMGSGFTTPCSPPITPQSMAEFDHHEEKHTLQQAELNNELQELTRALTIKEQLAAKWAANSNSISSLNAEYQENMKCLEEKIGSLQQERDMLVQQIQTVQSNKVSSKLAEQRRKRLQELESEMTALRKKLLEQSKIIKLKEKSDEKIVVLNNEIRSMKANKVRLIRQMRQENEYFRDWKLQRERELNKLRDQDRKRQNMMSRMETMHAKQQTVLKRKMEEAAAINKRLKEALLLQKQSQEKWHQTLGKPERVQSWMAQELEIADSTTAAVCVREKLIEDRALINKQLAALEKELKEAPVSDHARLNTEVLKQDLELRSAQIADINQKIMDSDQENKSRARWDTIQSMVDAKAALKYLFNAVVDAKRDAAMKECTIEQLEVSVLLRQLQQVESQQALLKDENRRLQLDSDELKCLKEKYRLLEEEVALVKQPTESNQKDDKFKTPKAPKPKTVKVQYTPGDIFSDNDENDDENDDDENDPDWQKTPLYKRLQKLKQSKASSSLNDQSSVAVKRTSDGTPACLCSKGICSRCVCRKTSSACSENCKCDPKKCVNRQDDISAVATESSFGVKRLRTESSPLLENNSEKGIRKLNYSYDEDCSI